MRNTAGNIYNTAELLKEAPALDSDLPHSTALHFHMGTLAFVHALQAVKGIGSEQLRTKELNDNLLSLKEAFELSTEQLKKLKSLYFYEKDAKEDYIQARFSELEEKVSELAKKKVKGRAKKANTQDDATFQEISKLQAILQIPKDVIDSKLQQKTTRLSENAFLVAVRDLALLRRYSRDKEDKILSISDISALSKRMPELEVTPRLLERAVQLFEQTINR